METALCTIDNKRYDMASFSKFDAQSLSNLRKALICPECRAQGYYRKASRDGKSACFGAYHEDNCEYKTQNSALCIMPEVVEEVESIATNNQIIEIAFSVYEPNKSKFDGSSTSDIKSTSKGTSKQHTVSSVRERNTQRGLKSLLRMLMHADSFASSDIEINTGAQHPFKAKNLFIHFDDISEEHLQKWRGYWGIISHANSDISWLNIANKGDVSIPVDKLKNAILSMCNAPAFFAHIKRHIYKMHLGFSFPVLGVVCGCCNACTTDLKYALHPARIQSDVKTHTVL